MAEGSESAEGFAATDYSEMDTKIKIHFLETLLARCQAAGKPTMSSAAVKRMDELYNLTASKNAELRVRWQRLCILHRCDFIVPHALQFVREAGRMKFVRPLYRELGAWAEQRDKAVATFKEVRTGYHPIAEKMLAQDLKVDEKA